MAWETEGVAKVAEAKLRNDVDPVAPILKNESELWEYDIRLPELKEKVKQDSISFEEAIKPAEPAPTFMQSGVAA